MDICTLICVYLTGNKHSTHKLLLLVIYLLDSLDALNVDFSPISNSLTPKGNILRIIYSI